MGSIAAMEVCVKVEGLYSVHAPFAFYGIDARVIIIQVIPLNPPI